MGVKSHFPVAFYLHFKMHPGTEPFLFLMSMNVNRTLFKKKEEGILEMAYCHLLNGVLDILQWAMKVVMYSGL